MLQRFVYITGALDFLIGLPDVGIEGHDPSRTGDFLARTGAFDRGLQRALWRATRSVAAMGIFPGRLRWHDCSHLSRRHGETHGPVTARTVVVQDALNPGLRRPHHSSATLHGFCDSAPVASALRARTQTGQPLWKRNSLSASSISARSRSANSAIRGPISTFPAAFCAAAR